MKHIEVSRIELYKLITAMCSLLFVIFLIVSLFPGSSSNGPDSNALGVMFSLIPGIYITFGVYKKLSEPGKFLEDTFVSLEMEFG